MMARHRREEARAQAAVERFDGFTAFLLKCGYIPPWEIKRVAMDIAHRQFDGGGERETWVYQNWKTYVGMAKSVLVVHRPRW